MGTNESISAYSLAQARSSCNQIFKGGTPGRGGPGGPGGDSGPYGNTCAMHGGSLCCMICGLRTNAPLQVTGMEDRICILHTVAMALPLLLQGRTRLPLVFLRHSWWVWHAGQIGQNDCNFLCGCCIRTTGPVCIADPSTGQCKGPAGSQGLPGLGMYGWACNSRASVTSVAVLWLYMFNVLLPDLHFCHASYLSTMSLPDVAAIISRALSVKWSFSICPRVGFNGQMQQKCVASSFFNTRGGKYHVII